MLVLFVAAAALTGCSKDKNDKITVATVDGEKVTKTEYLEAWDSTMQNFGITQDILDNPENAQYLDDLRQKVLESVVNQKVTKTELENRGYYDLTQEEHESVKTQVDTAMQNVLSYKQTEMMEELGDDYSDKDYAKAVNKYTKLALEEMGIDEEYVEEYFTYELVMEKAETALINTTVTDEELAEYFDQKVQEDKDRYADLAEYEMDSLYGEVSPYYTPEGLRMVRHVLIAFDDETVTEIRSLRQEGDDTAADKLKETSLEKIFDKASDVLSQLEGGSINFDTAILNYNDDPGMDSYPEGYQVSLYSERYIQEFTDAGMALKNIGDISGLVGTDFGYHILEYTSDVDSGPVDFELVKEELMDEAVSTKREEGWLKLLEEWMGKTRDSIFL